MLIDPYISTEQGEVFTWGWKECVPSGKVVGDSATSGLQGKDVYERKHPFLSEKGTCSNFIVKW